MTGVGSGTLEIQDLTRPELEEVFQDFGHDLVLVWPGKGLGNFDDEGREQRSPGRQESCRGLLVPASDGTRRAEAAAGLPIPSFKAYLPHNAPIAVPGWHLRYGDIDYYPTADARNPGGQGLLWTVTLGAPGEVVDRGPP